MIIITTESTGTVCSYLKQLRSAVRKPMSQSYSFCSGIIKQCWNVHYVSSRLKAVARLTTISFHFFPSAQKVCWLRFIDLDYMDCWHCSSRNILRHSVALPSYVFTIVRARAHRFGPWYNQGFWYNTMVYVSYIVETEAVNANNKNKYMP